MTLPIKETINEGLKLSLGFIKARPWVFLLFITISFVDSTLSRQIGYFDNIQNVVKALISNLANAVLAVFFLREITFFILKTRHSFQFNMFNLKIFSLYLFAALFDWGNYYVEESLSTISHFLHYLCFLLLLFLPFWEVSQVTYKTPKITLLQNFKTIKGYRLSMLFIGLIAFLIPSLGLARITAFMAQTSFYDIYLVFLPFIGMSLLLLYNACSVLIFQFFNENQRHDLPPAN